MDLTKRKCVPCGGGVSPLSRNQISELQKQISPEWKLSEDKNIPKIRKTFKFRDFKEAMVFVNKVANLAESEGHHPNIFVYYNKVELELYTHAIKGLHENDFVLAAKIDSL